MVKGVDLKSTAERRVGSNPAGDEWFGLFCFVLVLPTLWIVLFCLGPADTAGARQTLLYASTPPVTPIVSAIGVRRLSLENFRQFCVNQTPTRCILRAACSGSFVLHHNTCCTI